MVDLTTPQQPVLKNLVPQGGLIAEVDNGVITLDSINVTGGTVTSVTNVGGTTNPLVLGAPGPVITLLGLTAGTNTTPVANANGTVQIDLSNVDFSLTNAGSGSVLLVDNSVPTAPTVASIAAGTNLTIDAATTPGALILNSAILSNNEWCSTTTGQAIEYPYSVTGGLNPANPGVPWPPSNYQNAFSLNLLTSQSAKVLSLISGTSILVVDTPATYNLFAQIVVEIGEVSPAGASARVIFTPLLYTGTGGTLAVTRFDNSNACFTDTTSGSPWTITVDSLVEVPLGAVSPTLALGVYATAWPPGTALTQLGLTIFGGSLAATKISG